MTLLTLEDRRDEIRSTLAVQRRGQAADKVSEAITLGLLKADYMAEGRPAREFVTWICGDAFEHVSRAALYDRLSADVAISAGIRTAQDGGVEVYSHLVSAGRRLQRGVLPAAVQAEVDAGVVSIRAAKPEQAGLTVLHLPDIRLADLEAQRGRARDVYRRAGHEIPDTAPETLAAMIDLLAHCGDDVLLLAAHSVAGTLPQYLSSLTTGVPVPGPAALTAERLVQLQIWDRGEDALDPIELAWDADHAAELTRIYPTWDYAHVTEGGEFRAALERVWE